MLYTWLELSLFKNLKRSLSIIIFFLLKSVYMCLNNCVESGVPAEWFLMLWPPHNLDRIIVLYHKL